MQFVVATACIAQNLFVFLPTPNCRARDAAVRTNVDLWRQEWRLTHKRNKCTKILYNNNYVYTIQTFKGAQKQATIDSKTVYAC